MRRNVRIFREVFLLATALAAGPWAQAVQLAVVEANEGQLVSSVPRVGEPADPGLQTAPPAEVRPGALAAPDAGLSPSAEAGEIVALLAAAAITTGFIAQRRRSGD